ncbi:MAG TPA: peptigoglycan-binding protein LysM [Gemmobacter sp.]|nr:peptigoglycan-binding protein LysM [Gemmobacter sp.]
MFSTVRITPQGEALVAGQAKPGAEVSVMVDGAATVQARANDRGDFVAMFDLPPSDAPRILSLSQISGGVALGSTETVVLEPIAPPPAVVADAAPVDPAVPAEPVAEPAAPTAILLSDSGARVLQSPNALPGGSVSIAAITYTPDGGVQLSGLGAPGATVRLYLNNALRGEAAVTESGAWVSTLRGVLPGLYSLRADQVDGAGAVTSRFETPFQRESLEALAAVMKPQAVVAGPASAPPLTDAGVPAPPPAAALAVPDGPVNITVQPGFTLWQIARERFGDGVLYVKVYDANRDQIRDPDLIYPGQVFTIPGQ